MSNVAIFETNKQPTYLTSVNEYEYESNSNALINPDISAVQNVPLKYWKRVGDTIQEMTLTEKQMVEAKELLARKNAADNFSISDMKIVLIALIKVINIRFPAGSKITSQEMIDALKAEIT